MDASTFYKKSHLVGMRYRLRLSGILVLFCLMGIGEVMGATYSHSITSTTWTAYGSQTLTGVAWTATATGGAYWGYDATKGQQFGSANNPAKPLTLSTTGISGTITSVKVTTAGASSIAGTVSVSVGGTAFSPASAALTATSTAYTFTGSKSGEIKITWTQTSSKALYIKAIEVTYSSSSQTATPTFSPAGGSYASAQSVTLSSTTSGAKIYYTTNGSEPTSSSALYAGAIAVSSTTTIKAIAYDASNANPSSVASATYTITAPAVGEPTNHATAFTATTNTSSQITVTWTDATGATAPAGYLVKASTGTPTAPVDGTAETDGSFVKNIAKGTQLVVFTGLSASTTYNFAIWPYTNSGSAIDYKTGSQPTASATTASTSTPLAAPVATAATGISATGFIANWDAVAGATAYDVNVYTKTAGSGTANIFSENFDGFSLGATGVGANSTDVSTTLDTKTQTTGWTGLKIYDAGGTVKMGSSSVLGYIVTPAIDLLGNSGNFNISFKSMAWSGDATSFKIYLNDVLVSTVTPLNNDVNYTLSDFSIDLTGGTAASKIKFEGSVAAKGRFFLEDLVISQGSASSSSPISGSPFAVTGSTNKVLTGLTNGIAYYYTVVAKKGTESSVASNEITVTTSVSTNTGNITAGSPSIISANGKLVVSQMSDNSTVRVFDTMGRMLVNRISVNGSIEIPLQVVGIYTVRVDSGTKNWTIKVVNNK